MALLLDQIQLQLGDEALVAWDRDGVTLLEPSSWADPIPSMMDTPHCLVMKGRMFVVYSNGRYVAVWVGDRWLCRHIVDPYNGDGNESVMDFLRRAAEAVSISNELALST